MANEKGTFLNWVGFKEGETTTQNSVDRIRELEAQLADLRSRRDITSLSKEEFEILATETAMSMIKSAQAREQKAFSASERVVSEASKTAREALEGAESKARALLSGAESRGRKYITTAESEAEEILSQAKTDAEAIFEEKRREVSALALAARREGERMISEAQDEVVAYRQWLSQVMSDAERLNRIQTQSLNAAENAIAQGRSSLETAFARLSDLQKKVSENLTTDGGLLPQVPKKVVSQRTKPALDAPKKSASKKSAPKKSASKKSAPKKSAKKTPAKRR
jgi:cell division septum initiation protein DivIVA